MKDRIRIVSLLWMLKVYILLFVMFILILLKGLFFWILFVNWGDGSGFIVKLICK